MSLITRCPACGTMFKVVPDQLRISEGWVRCGQCAEIFDATSNLREPEPAATPEPAAVPAEVPLSPDPAQAPVTAQASLRTADASDSIAPPPLYPWFPSEVHDSELPRESRIQEEPDLDSVSFVRKARRRAMWRRPMVRLLLLVVVVVLAAALTLQYAMQERDRLAATQPQLRPLLQLLCGQLRCEVQPARQIDAIVIDSSSFNRLRTDAYRLSFTLRNQAAMPVAMPSLELTLTDSQDQPVIRSVLAPRDLGAASVIPAAGESSSAVTVSVAPGGGSNRIAGYRVLAFYP